MTEFIWGEMQQRIKYGFSIILLAVNTIRLFEEKLKLSHIVAVPQAHHRPRLILNMLAHPNYDMPSINYTTNREDATDLLQFGKPPPCILKAVW